jgi:hypothetical protein
VQCLKGDGSVCQQYKGHEHIRADQSGELDAVADGVEGGRDVREGSG